jgi:pimeloyl-ACP methyl ester carboxylesterase
MKVPIIDGEIAYRSVDVAGSRIFYREAGPSRAPTILLLHGFPSSSHQFRRLLELLGDRYHLVAPDYPGFGYSDAPARKGAGGDFVYSFDRLADTMEAFCLALRLERFFLYVFDYGGPVGLRVAERHPEWIAGLIVQNANAYLAGLSSTAQEFVALRSEVPDARDKVMNLLTVEMTRFQYQHGAADPARVAPDGWTLDQHFLDRPGRKEIQVDLALDYHSNVERYDAWQAWLRKYQPPTLIVWGRNDPFFTEAGARAYLDDLPAAELHLFDTGHFALEEQATEIARLIASFIERR